VLVDGIDQICIRDECVPVGLVAGIDGELLRGHPMFWGEIPDTFLPERLRSVSAAIFHPLRPDGGRLDCEGLLGLKPSDRRDAGFTNLAAWNAGRASMQVGDVYVPRPVNRVPVSSPGLSYIVLFELYDGNLSLEAEPTGAILAEGCVEDIEVVEGRYVDFPDDPRFSHVIELRGIRG
jgi:hypothetical protein